MNTVTITGTIKNVQLRGKSERKVLTGNLVQTGIINEWGKVGCIATMPLVFLDEAVAKQAQELQKDEYRKRVVVALDEERSLWP